MVVVASSAEEREVEMLAGYIEMLKVTQVALIRELEEAKAKAREQEEAKAKAALVTSLEEAKAQADRTLMFIAETEGSGKRSRRRSDDDDDEEPLQSLRYRSSSSDRLEAEDSYASLAGRHEEGVAYGYRGLGSKDDDDDGKPNYRGVSLTILRSDSGPADEFDADFADGDELEVTYRSSGGVTAAGGGERLKPDLGALKELVATFAALVAEGAAADEKYVWEQLERVKAVLVC